MTDTQLFERLAATDAYPEQLELPSEVWTAEYALRQIDDLHDGKAFHEPLTSGRSRLSVRRPLLVAAAAMAVVLFSVAVVWSLTRSSTGPDVIEPAPLSPLEVVGVLNAAITDGDLEAIRQLWADNATRVGTFAGVGNADNPTDLSERCFGGQALCWSISKRSIPDWDGDGEVRGHDDMLTVFAWLYVTGVTEPYTDCVESANGIVTCSSAPGGGAFLQPSAGITSFVIEDGKITHADISSPESCSDVSGPLCSFVVFGSYESASVFPYIDWLRENKPELADTLSDFVGLKINPDTIEQHHRFIAEWRQLQG